MDESITSVAETVITYSLGSTTYSSTASNPYRANAKKIYIDYWNCMWSPYIGLGGNKSIEQIDGLYYFQIAYYESAQTYYWGHVIPRENSSLSDVDGARCRRNSELLGHCVANQILDDFGNRVYIVSSTGLKRMTRSFFALDSLGMLDYDADGLTNIEEIDMESGLITKIEDDRYEYPTLKECLAYGNVFTEEGLERLYNDKVSNNLKEYLNKIKVLPLISDPTMKDSDGDGIADGSVPLEVGKESYINDEKPLVWSYLYYDDELKEVLRNYPNAKVDFIIYDFTLQEFVDAQYYLDNPIPKTNIKKYQERDNSILNNRNKSSIYDSVTDGSFMLCTYDAMEYFVNIDSYFSEESIFAFYDIYTNKKDYTIDDAKNLLKGTVFEGKDNIANAFLEASKLTGIDLLYLIAKCKDESGIGINNPNKSMFAIEGKESEGKRYYNMYGYAAYDNNATNGMFEYSKKKGWDSQEKAIIGGAESIYDNYIENKFGYHLNTAYFQRYNADGWATGSLYPQYGSNICMANQISEIIFETLSCLEMDISYSPNFIIPVFYDEVSKNDLER